MAQGIPGIAASDACTGHSVTTMSTTLHRETLKLASGRSQQIARAGRGPTVVWLHGVHGLQDHDPVVAALAERYSVIAPLAPGFNDLAELDELRTIHDLALHYDDVLGALGLDRIALIGHSIGAMVAAELAAHFPAKVSRLALLSPVGLWDDARPVADLFARPYPTIDKILWLGGAPTGPMATKPDQSAQSTPGDQVEALVTIARGMTAVAKFLWPIPDKGLRRRLYRIRARTLIVAGERDAFVPASYAADFAAAILDARSLVIADAAHMAPYERTREVLEPVHALLAAA